GTLTNLVPTLRQYPVDHAANVLAAIVITFTAVRYRLFNIDILIQRGFVRTVALIPSIALCMVLLALAFPPMRAAMSTLSGAALSIGVMTVVGFTSPTM